MIAEQIYIRNAHDPIYLLKHEAIDRLNSIVGDLPKYKINIEELIINFSVDDVICLMNTIYRDEDFKKSRYYRLYNGYFDEIEDLIYKFNNSKCSAN
jgi:hypothetical protein